MTKDEAAFPITDMAESDIQPALNWIEDHRNSVGITRDRITKAAILGVCAWSLVETPLEIGISHSYAWLLALAVSKSIVIATGVGAIARIRVARAILAFICGASLLAIVPALPLVYFRSLEIAAISTVECALKTVCLGALCLSSLQKRSMVDSGLRKGRSQSDDTNIET